jgi:hypothetical protein
VLLHRVHLDVYAAEAFNPGIKGNARFSPIVNATGKPIPTLYGGTSFNCAAMETVFHDVPFAPGLKTFAKHKLEGQLHSVLVAAAALRLADLRNVPLRKLGVERKQLIDTEKDTYGQTRKWAANHPRAACAISRAVLDLAAGRQCGWRDAVLFDDVSRTRTVIPSPCFRPSTRLTAHPA